MEARPHVYVELLTNIRQLTIYISFPAAPPVTAPCTPQQRQPCRVTLSDTRDSILVCCGRHELAVTLPARAGESAHARLQAYQWPQWPIAEPQEVSVRIPADLPPKGASGDSSTVDVDTWSASLIAPGSRVCCRACWHELLQQQQRGGPQNELVWKDLPSANWAELMELWHCQKPSEPKGSSQHGEGEEASRRKGHGAANQVMCTPDTVLVDVASFYVAQENCPSFPALVSAALSLLRFARAVKKEPASIVPMAQAPMQLPEIDQPHVFYGTVGETSRSLLGYRIYKTSAALKVGESRLPPVPASSLITAQLLELADRTSVRRFAVYPAQPGQGGPSEGACGMLLWLFNTDLRFTSTAAGADSPARAVKVLSRQLSALDLQNIVNPSTAAPSSINIEELGMPGSAYRDLQTALAESSAFLPVSAQKARFGTPEKADEWTVGLLTV
ncbi:hypothetical protein KEM52_000456 [Ascosphaera acerosa]|nr:hypothetical protein KEM52_000456 [Ascosphaera acerosa]